jgi:hypothetical protein
MANSQTPERTRRNSLATERCVSLALHDLMFRLKFRVFSVKEKLAELGHLNPLMLWDRNSYQPLGWRDELKFLSDHKIARLPGVDQAKELTDRGQRESLLPYHSLNFYSMVQYER